VAQVTTLALFQFNVIFRACMEKSRNDYDGIVEFVMEGRILHAACEKESRRNYGRQCVAAVCDTHAGTEHYHTSAGFSDMS
jgi:L-amino acid N-acyltransferase YncA